MADDSHKQPSNTGSAPGSKVEIGADIVSGLAGLGAGVAAPPPVGAAVGVITAVFVRTAILRLVYEFQRRQLSPREKYRVDRVIIIAAEHIQARLDQGDQPRDDDFFAAGASDRSAAEEIAEALIRSVRDDPQEKKLPYYARLLANLAFDATIDPASAYVFVRMAEGLTYRQLCMIAIGIQKINTAPDRNEPLRDPLSKRTQTAKHGLVEELHQLREQGFMDHEGFYIGHRQWHIGEPTSHAEMLYRLMGLETIDAQDINALTVVLREPTSE
jgi:hypothetical protein